MKAYYFSLNKIYSLRFMVNFYCILFNPETKQVMFWKMSKISEDFQRRPCAQAGLFG